MLSDREREVLDEVQHRFVIEVWLDESSHSIQWAYTLPSWAYTTAMIVAVASGVVMLLDGAPGSALVFATLATAISLLAWSRNQAARRES